MAEEAIRRERGVGLVLCPCFTFGSPPLALASLQAVLRADGRRTVPFDLDFMFLRGDPAAFHAFYGVYNIGHASGRDRVQFVIRPWLSLQALVPEAFSAEERAPYAEELAAVEPVRRFLVEWAETMLAEDLGAVLITTYVSSLLPSLLLAQALKARDPSIGVAFGGPGVGSAEIQEWVLRLGLVDACASGEGERIAPPLAAALLAGESLADVPGIAYLQGETPARNPAPPLIALSELRTPDFSGFPVPGRRLRDYRSNPNVDTLWFGAALSVATTRGCVKRCTFCSETNYWERFRQRKPAAVVDELCELHARWGVRQFLFGDSLLNGNPRWLEAFATLCRERALGFQFLFAYFRPTQLPRPLLEAMAAAGFRLLAFGLETASQEILDTLQKGTHLEEVETIVLDAIDVGIHVNLSILCGFPGETAEHVLESIRFIQRLQQRALARSGPEKARGLVVYAGSSLRLEPYSRMFKFPAAAGIQLEPVEPALPAALQHLGPALTPLLTRWSCGLSAEEVQVRSSLLYSSIHRDATVIFQSDPFEDWIEEELRVAPVRPARVLVDETGGHYLAGDGKVLAHLDPLASRVWEHIGRGESYGEIQQALAGELPADELETQLTRVFVQLLSNRLVYAEDFARPHGAPEASVP